MVATTALLCAFSITPYIYLNRGANNLQKSTRWLFPVLRATGGFITATLIQLLIQRRIIILSQKYLVKLKNGDQPPKKDIETAVERHTKKHSMDARTWLLLCILLLGILASVVGYVGCFSVVQNSLLKIGPVGWLCLEAGLSVMRLVIWAWNPTRDDAPPLEIILELDEYECSPLPTCNKDNEEILKYKVLPLTRAREFLKFITSFTGLIEPFSNPDLSLYYTLTRKRPSNQSVPADGENERENGDNGPENATKHKLGERSLYITVFDHKERTTRVYTRDDKGDIFYSTNSNAPLVNVGHLLEVEIDAPIDAKSDPVCSDSNNLDSLRKHHRSILEHIRYRVGAASRSKAYTIENSWTMKLEDTISARQRLREEENGNDWKTAVEKGKEEERKEESSLICDYFKHSSIERERMLLDEKRVKWITRRMEMISKETKERFEGEYRVNKQAVENKQELPMKMLSFLEQYFMELLLVYEVKEWEQRFWNEFQVSRDQICNDRVDEKERLTREWRTNCWKRLNPQMRAAEKRLADLDKHNDWFERQKVHREWTSYIRQFFEGIEIPNSEALSDLKEEMRDSYLVDVGEIRLRMEREIEDTEFRLKRGSELGRFDQFWNDNTLFKCRYSPSKWLYLNISGISAPLDIYSRALKGNENIILITFSHSDSDSDTNWIQDTIRDLPRVTSISQGFGRLPAIHRDPPLFIKSTNNDLITFAQEIRPKLNSSTYIFMEADRSNMYSDPVGLGNNARVLISFVAPTSGQSLILRLKHSGKEDGPLEVTLGSTIIQLNPSSNSLLTTDDITLHPIPDPSESDHLSFEPGIRNDIVIQVRGTAYWQVHGHFLYDIELLDEAGKHYGKMDPEYGG